MSSIFNNKSILITGGTGSFGKTFARYLVENEKPKKVIIFSRDEFKQHMMRMEFAKHESKMRYFLGDVRDLDRLQRAFKGVDIVVHAAALKQVPAVEYDPFEGVKTNILGSQNVITAAIDQGVGQALLVSTDKAAEPVNLYGATKMCAEKLFVASNVYSPHGTKFAAVRYGNLVLSRGSVTETLLRDSKNHVQITHEEMTRFWMTFDGSHQLVNYALTEMEGGEVFVPKIPSMKITDLFKTLAPKAKHTVSGLRAGERIHEILLTDEESMRSFDLGKYFVILPHRTISPKGAKHYEKYAKMGKATKHGFSFRSDTNEEWLEPSELKRLLKLETVKHV